MKLTAYLWKECPAPPSGFRLQTSGPLLTSLKLILLTLIVSVSAIANGLPQNITLSQKNATPEMIIAAVKKQAHLVFVYNREVLKDATPINVSVKDMPVDQFLGIAFQDQPFRWYKENQTVVLERKVTAGSNAAVNSLWQFTTVKVKGRVTGNELPLSGATISVKGKHLNVVTDEKGYFELNTELNSVLLISYVGYMSQEVKVVGDDFLSIQLLPSVNGLDTAQIVMNTGYQQLPRERSTGSFSTVTDAQLQRRPVLNLLDKLEGYASGLSFHRNSFEEQPKLSVRGRSTIYANDKPLIVVDGFPIEGDINSINPNDVQSVTLLKDAAASSIWGARAANGVIVIATRKGKFNQRPVIELRSQFSSGSAPDLHYIPLMNSGDFVELEKQWFDAGRYSRYDREPRHTRQPLSDGISIMMDQQKGRITEAEAQQKLAALKNQDIRSEAERVLYRKSMIQQHSLNITGGGEHIRYHFFTGYDKELTQVKGNSSDRLTLRMDNTFRLTPKLQLNTAINTAWRATARNGIGMENFISETLSGVGGVRVGQYVFYPYQRLLNDDGSAVSIARKYDQTYNSYLNRIGFKDWMYRPAEEIGLRDNTTKINDVRLNAGLDYRFSSWLKLDLRYQFEQSASRSRNLQGVDLYYTRNYINELTAVLPDSSGVTNNLPVGGILDNATNTMKSHVLRSQIDINKEWDGGDHGFAAIAGIELMDTRTDIGRNRRYGYDDRTLTFMDVDHNRSYREFSTNRSTRILSDELIAEARDRYASFYSNASYTYLSRYILSASARMDKSNLFGIDPKDRNVPLWSAGLAWVINREAFFKSETISGLKLRATYGYNGNISKSETAYPVADVYMDSYTGLPFARVASPGNSMLQWETVSQLNLGADITLWNGSVGISAEYFYKKGADLLGETFLDPTSGFGTIRANLAGMKGSGFDLELNVTTGKKLVWQSRWLFSHATDKITEIAVGADNIYNDGAIRYMAADRSLLPVKGRPVYSIYSYRFGGLDGNGNPQLLNKEGKITPYTDVLMGVEPGDLVYHGPVMPVFFGGWSNTFTFKGISFTANISYKLGHYFRRNSINYRLINNASFRGIGHADYAKRWQKPGDEQHTNVPSALPYGTLDAYRDKAYLYSDILVEKGDHVRLKDINISYDLPLNTSLRKTFSGIQLYVFINNIGILWKANDQGIDPDVVPLNYSNQLPMPRTITAGAKVQF